MTQALEAFFSGAYMPHGHCYLWYPGILWINVISDALISLAYFSIPLILLIFVKQRPELRFKSLFVLFSLFILCCGVTHLFSIYTIWHGTYGLHGISKAVTAAVSVATALTLYLKLPELLMIPTIEQLERAQLDASEERFRRFEVELQRKSDSMFRHATQMLPVGLLVVDADGNVRLTNDMFEHILGYQASELDAEPLCRFIDDGLSLRHNVLTNDSNEQSSESPSVAAPRVVNGIKKNGEIISLSIKTSVHEFEGETFTFAVVNQPDKERESSERLAQEITRMKRAIDASNDGLWEWDVQNNRVWYSQRLMRMIGKDPADPARLSDWHKHVHEKDQDRVQICLEAHFKHKTPFDVTYQGLNADGAYVWLRSRGSAIFDANGAPLLMSGTLTDIENLKQLETDLAKNANFLNQVLEKSLNGLYILDVASMSKVFINPEYTRITGYDDADLRSMGSGSFLQHIHPEDRDAVSSHIENVLQDGSGKGIGIEYRLKHKSNRWIWCYSRDSIYAYDNGKPKEILGSFFDITEQKNREQEFKSLAQDFASTFEQAAVGIAHLDINGNFLKVNQKLCDILYYEPEELVQQNFIAITHETDRKHSQAMLTKLTHGDIEQCDIENRYTRRSGDVIWANNFISPVRNDDGSFKHFIVVIEDTSDRKHIEISLEESNASLERFAYSASHDLQEPLRKISSFAGMLKNRLSETTQCSETIFELDRIDKAAQRMSEMISSLLQLSRYARQHLVKSEILLSSLSDEVLEDISHVVNHSHAIVTVDLDAEIYVEHNAFKQVLQNLITNAISYATPGSTAEISISAQIMAHETRVIVEDNGPGFDMLKAEEIFEPFRRLVGKDHPGTGMGLAICRQIIKAHGGIIFAEQGKRGARFIIRLPKRHNK